MPVNTSTSSREYLDARLRKAAEKESRLLQSPADNTRVGTKQNDKLSKLVERINRTSNADFVKRLIDEKRKVLDNPDGTVSTHELGYVDDGKGNAVVFPAVQTVGDTLLRFPYPQSLDRAIENRDTLMMSVPEAEMFTKGYKEYYPGFNKYAGGGNSEKERTDSKIPLKDRLFGIRKDIERLSKGKIKKEDVEKVYQNPSNWATLLFSPDEISDIRQRLYDNFYPIGYNYDRLTALSKVAFDGFDEIGEKHNSHNASVFYDNPVHVGTVGTIVGPSIRDEAWGTYLQPEKQRARLHNHLTPTEMRPASGATYDRVFSFNRKENKNFPLNLVESYNSALRGIKYYPIRDSGMVDGSYRVFEKGKTPGFFTVDSWGYGPLSSAHGTPEDILGGTYTISSGVDPEKGQFVSYYDDYDLNPVVGGKSAGNVRWPVKPIRLGDASGGIGNPFSIYDRVYLDDFYDVSSQPDNGDYYGGYIVPAIIDTKK